MRMLILFVSGIVIGMYMSDYVIAFVQAFLSLVHN